MMQSMIIVTSVDITPTGVRRKTDDPDWYLKRNQQRNLDTLLQVIGLRCQPLQVEVRVLEDFKDEVKMWALTFETDRSDVLGKNGELFLQDIEGVPIMTGLTETTPSFPQRFMTKGALKNIDIFNANSK